MILEKSSSEGALAADLARRLIRLIQQQPRLVLGLPTGRTTLSLYAELVGLSASEGVDWSSIHTFNLDEFVGLGNGDPGSYRSFMDQRLFRHVNIRADHVEFLDGRATDLRNECERYETAITTAGGIDLMILGIGANGHIGFNEPADALAVRTHRVVLDEETRAGNALWFGGALDRVPREALTMGMATILGARTIILIATGEAKTDAVNAMLEGTVTTRWPASFLQLHPHVTVMVDEFV